MKKPAVNFFPFSSPALQSSSGAEEIAANTVFVPMPRRRKATSASSCSAGSGSIVPGRITQS